MPDQSEILSRFTEIINRAKDILGHDVTGMAGIEVKRPRAQWEPIEPGHLAQVLARNQRVTGADPNELLGRMALGESVMVGVCLYRKADA